MVCNHEWVYAPFLDMKAAISPYASIQRVCNGCGVRESVKADTCKPGTSEFYKVLRRFAETNVTLPHPTKKLVVESLDQKSEPKASPKVQPAKAKVLKEKEAEEEAIGESGML